MHDNAQCLETSYHFTFIVYCKHFVNSLTPVIVFTAITFALAILLASDTRLSVSLEAPMSGVSAEPYETLASVSVMSRGVHVHLSDQGRK